MVSQTDKTAQPPVDNTLQILADSPYMRVKIQETSQDKDARWGPLFVGINDYSVRIPRGEEVIIAKPLLDQMFLAARRRSEILVQPVRSYTAEQAHEERLLGNTPVYPAKVTPSSIKPKGTK